MIKPRIVAIDFGKIRFGVAKTDPFHHFVEPMGTFNEANLFEALKLLHRESNIGTFIVGEPLNYDGSKNNACNDVGLFIERLRDVFPLINIVRFNEYGSTIQANEFLKHRGISRPKRLKKGKLDQVVAMQLLESYLLKA